MSTPGFQQGNVSFKDFVIGWFNNLWVWSGMSGDGSRFYRKVFGEQQPSAENLLAYYRYDAMANRVGNTMPDACWMPGIRIMAEEADPEDDPGQLEQAIIDIDRELRKNGMGMFEAFAAADKANAYGEYAAIFCNFGDGDVAMPATSADNLLGLTVFSEINAPVNAWIDDPRSPRNGRPKNYRTYSGKDWVDDRDGWNRRGRAKSMPQKSKQLIVDASRMVHIAENAVDNAVFGMPRLRAVFPYLQMLYKVLGSTTESHWLSARNSMFVKLDEQFKADDAEEFKKDLEAFNNQLKDVLVARGADFQTAQTSPVSPRDVVEKLIQVIAAVSKIPQRILVGNEAGQLASTQDESNFSSVVSQRRVEFCEGRIIVPFVNKLMEMGVLPEEDFKVEWPPLSEASAKDKAAVAQTLSGFGRNIAESISKGLPMTLVTQICEQAGFDVKDLEAEIEEQKAEAEAKAAEIAGQMQPEDENGDKTGNGNVSGNDNDGSGNDAADNAEQEDDEDAEGAN